jgi:hypothetical protein
MLTKAEIEGLIRRSGGPSASIYMPRHVGGREVRQDPARLKNLVVAAEGKLAEIGVRPEAAAPLLAPARALVEDDAFWREQAHGLALFLSQDGMRSFHLPFEPAEHVCAGERFHVFPLLRATSGDHPFLVLTISARRACLYDASRDHILPASVPLPGGVQSVISRTDYDGEGSPEDYSKAEFIQYIREVSKAVEDYARRARLPIILVALPESQGHFRALGNHPELLYVGVSENPDAMSLQHLHARALDAAAPVFAAADQKILDRFNTMAGGTRVSTEVADIAEAARIGRVEALILSEDCEAQVEEKLLDDAIACALATGAQAHILPQIAMPERTPAAAIFRY